MDYSIKQLSEIAGVSTRTLRYYDEIGLLKPMYVNEAGYRFYGKEQMDILQQIMFYKERGFELKQIADIVKEEEFDIMAALQDHLQDLKNQKSQLNLLIKTVDNTITSMRGKYKMNDSEKFEAFKKSLIEENEEKYGEEIREKYGKDEVEASNRKLLNMSQEEYQYFEKLGKDIVECLKEAVLKGAQADSEEGKHIFELHKEWLCKTWKKYSAEAHKGLAQMYVYDERFKSYYNSHTNGCAEFLNNIIQYWAK